MYKINRCKECKQEVHVHRMSYGIVLKNTCDHITNGHVTTPYAKAKLARPL